MVLPLGDLHRTQIVPYVTYALIAINVAVFLVQQQKGDEFTLAYAATPYEITHNEDLDQPVPKLVHGPGARPVRRGVHWSSAPLASATRPVPDPGAMDLADVDVSARELDALDRQHALPLDRRRQRRGSAGLGPLLDRLFRLRTGRVQLAQIAIDPDSVTPTLGASGAIAGIMGAYVIWFPHNQIRVLLFRFITVLPAVIVIGGWIVLQIWLGANSLGGQRTRGRGLPGPCGRGRYRHRRRLAFFR